MKRTRFRIPAALCLTMVLAVAAPFGIHAQESAPKNDAEKDAEKDLVRQLLERLEKVETELSRLKNRKPGPPAGKPGGDILAVLETPYLGTTFYGSNEGVRYFAARLIFVNLTDQTHTIKREAITLQADELRLSMGEVPPRMRYQGFQVENRQVQLQNVKPAAQLKIAPGGTASTWVLFTEIPFGNQIPELVIRAKWSEEKETELDVNEFALGLLGLNVERIGPRDSLALLTVSGTVNTINVGSLIDTLDGLAAKQVARAVIRWTETATPLSGPLLGWFQQSSFRAGRTAQANQPFPPIPASIRELHLARVPNYTKDGNLPGPEAGLAHIHRTDIDAVAAALRSAYEVLPRDELLREIEQGHRLTRAAALAGGGGRLLDDQLPEILKLADDEDVDIQRAALAALRHFGDQRAIDKLIAYVKKGAAPLSAVAIESLAASRFAAAHQSLLGVLTNESPDEKKTIVRVLARYPRPIWSETIFEFARDPHSEVCGEALAALVRIGHADLLTVFEQALEKGDQSLREKAFSLLAAQTDPQSEKLAMQYTLGHLEESAPNPLMHELLKRTKDPRAIPLLLKQFDQADANRPALIHTLAAIGDQRVAEVLGERYGRLQNNEKVTVLRALHQMKSPVYLQLAREAINSGDNSLIGAACEGLQSEGSPEAIRILVVAFETLQSESAWKYTANSLGTLGTSEARKALEQARESKNEKRRAIATNALRILRRHSPAYPYLANARGHMRKKEFADAVKKFTHALKLDSELPEIYSGRGNAYLNLKKYKEARDDFKKAVELDSYDSQAVSGLGICLAVEGKYDEADKLIEGTRKKFRKDAVFAYNSACVFARAVEHLNGNNDAANRKTRIADFQKRAVADLKRSVEMGFRDFDWMKQDPDLNSLHEYEGFKQILESADDDNAKG